MDQVMLVGLAIMGKVDIAGLNPEEEMIMYRGLYISKMETYVETFGKESAKVLEDLFAKIESKPLIKEPWEQYKSVGSTTRLR